MNTRAFTLFFLALAAPASATSSTARIVAMQAKPPFLFRDELFFIDSADPPQNTSLHAEHLSSLSPLGAVFSRDTHKVALTSSSAFSPNFGFVDINSGEVTQITTLPNIGNYSIISMAVAKLAPDAPEVVFLVAMNWNNQSWADCLLYVTNPRTNQVKLAAHFDAPAGYRFWPTNSLVYDDSTGTFLFTVALLSDGPNTLTLRVVRLDPKTSSAWVPLPNMPSLLTNEIYDFNRFHFNASFSPRYVFVDFGYRVRVLDLTTGFANNYVDYNSDCMGFTQGPGVVDWTLFPGTQCASFWRIADYCQSKLSIPTLIRVPLCNGFVQKPQKQDAPSMANPIAVI